MDTPQPVNPTPQSWQTPPTSSGMGSIFNAPPKMTFALGIMVGVSLISLLGFILSFTAYRNAVDGGTTQKAAVTNTNTAVAAANTNAAPAAPVNIAIDPKTDWITGNKNAKVTVVEFSDYQCPYCGQFETSVNQMMTDYGSKIRLVYKNYPLTSIHPFAQKAAETAECAGAQGKYWQMHDKLFANQATLSNDNFKQWAKDLGLNTTKFNTCLDNSQTAAKIAADQKYGDTVGVTGTPTTFVDGIAIQGAQSYDTLKGLIDQELAKA